LCSTMSNFLCTLKSLPADKYHTGISNNYKRRLEFHNSIEKGFTARYRPWEVVFFKEYNNRKEAYEAE